MNTIARWRCIAVACAIVFLLPLAPFTTAAAQNMSQDLEDWQRDELQSLVEIVVAALSGELVQLDDPFSVQPDYLKGTDNLTYVPFTLSVDPTELTASSLAVYLYVVPHQEAPPAGTEESDDDDELPESVFEDAYFVDVSAARAEGGSIELSRAFTAEGGHYDVYIALRESLGPDAEDADHEAAVMMMSKSEVQVPDFWNGELQTSSVILAEGQWSRSISRSPRRSRRRTPTRLGTTRIIPKRDYNFVNSDELSLYHARLQPRGDLGPEAEPHHRVQLPRTR